MQERIWDHAKDYDEYMNTLEQTPADMLREFHDAFEVKRWGFYPYSTESKEEVTSKYPQFLNDSNLALKLIEEEFDEMIDSEDLDNAVKEMADLIYVTFGLADRFGIDLMEALRRVHISNMSKLDSVTGRPIRREDGKILKGPNYKEADMEGTYIAYRT